ncbi:MAG: site-specific integrase [Rickettsiales bacterium]|jgi:integrase|nr:site-specific integrase [Rickettsiales bacterium]
MAPIPTRTKFNFTEASVAALPFAERGKRYIVYDTSTKNLILRVGENSKVYYLLKKANNRVIYVRLGDVGNTSLKTARELLIDNIKVVANGKNPNDEKKKFRKDMTIKEFFEKVYMPQHSMLFKKPSSQKDDKNNFRLYLMPIHNRKMLDITHADIDRLHKQIGANNGIYMANHAIRLIRQMYNKAIGWGFPGPNPATHIQFFKETKRDRFLQEEELPRLFRALMEESNTMFRNFVLLSLWLGQRRRNMQAIRWTDINFDRQVLYIKETKNGDPQVVPIPRQALELLREMETFKASEWLFPSAKSASGHLETPAKMWKSLLERANIENLRIHDLRRTFASYQAITGSSHAIIGKALGDKSPAVIPTYARLSENPVRQSIQTAADAMEALALPKPADAIK